jgi:autophagy-related protein 9
MAYPYANAYIAQFPKDKTEQISAFVAFVVGAFAFVLFSITLLDSELFLNFEITPGKTALFWIGIFTAIYRVARSSSPQEDHVPDPEYYLRHVNYHTHYEPPSWQDRLHTDEVRQEFSQLYQPKVLIFAEEVLSMVITPFLLIFRLPGCSDRIVDFFREFSIVVDGLGVVCSYSMFGFQKGVQKPPSSVLRAPPGADAGGRGVSREGPDLREDYFNTRDDKMVKSYYGFLDAYNMDGKGKSQGKGNFHPPPQFPNTFGAMSQTGALPGEMSIRGTSRDLLGRHPHSRRRDDPAINSILLDPHHQPSASALRNSPRQAPHGRYRSHLHPPSELPGISSRNSRIEEESTLGDSWRTGRPGEEEEEEDEADTRGGNRGGVLQLLRQFSQAQTEGRAVGI